MKIAVWAVGRMKKTGLEVSMDHYMKRIRQYHPVSVEEILVRVRSTDPVILRKAEGEKILSRLAPNDFLVLMDENGSRMDSVQFAEFIQKTMMEPVGRIIFLIGGAHGFDAAVYDRARFQVSLSAMTFTHDLARLITIEQLYRAFSILNNSPYHH